MNQTSKSVSVYLLLCLTIISSCRRYKPPEVELCISKETNDTILICNNPALPDNQREYERNISLGDIVTNGNDYQRMRDYCGGLREKLIECEAN